MADSMTAREPRILVVDDMPENTRLLRSFLAPRGYVVVVATSGQAALNLVAENPPDIVLLDLMMPGMDGFTVCNRLKQSPETCHIPIIIITGLGEREANIRAIEAGADDFLVKPFDVLLLDARLHASLRTKRLQDQLLDYRQQLELQNQLLEKRVRERTAQVALTRHVAVFSMAKLAESRDTETGDHLERMRAYARVVALSLRRRGLHEDVITDDFVNELYETSPLHDIGKVGIPDKILLKPGKLTPEEFEIMKEHARIGGECLLAAEKVAAKSSFLGMACQITWSHHEKWDGTGYPEGLQGTAIPLPARIVAIADVYDALSSRRPYKESFHHEKCIAIIEEGRGTHFDPDVCDAFMDAMPEILEIRDRFHHDTGISPIQEIMMRIERTVANQASA